jgi:hypothetical protein
MRRPAARRSLKRLLLLLVLFLVVDHLVLPQLAGARHAVDVLDDVEPAWLVAGVVLEILSIAAFARLTWTLLPPPSRPSMPTMVRITLSTLGLSHVIPGGTAAGTSLGYRLLTNAGASGSEAAFAIASQGLGSAVVLNLLLWAGLVWSIPARGFDPLYGTAAIPLTPGGLGVVEATLTALLVGFGVPRGEALVGVVAYRVANFWLPIPAGAAAYLALKVTGGTGAGSSASWRRVRSSRRPPPASGPSATASGAAPPPRPGRRSRARRRAGPAARTGGSRRGGSTPPRGGCRSAAARRWTGRRPGG